MDPFFALLGIVSLFAALLLPGFVLGKVGAVNEESMLSFSNILMCVAMPFLVFLKLLEIDIRSIGACEIIIASLLPIGMVFILLLICKLFFKGGKVSRRTATFCSIFSNCGFFGMPLATAMWPENPVIVLYISIFNVVSTFLLLTLGAYIMSGDKKNISVTKNLISPIFFSIVLGVIASFCNLAEIVPYIKTYSVTLAQLTTPLAMITLGYELSKMNLLKMWTNAYVYISSLIKLVISPLITLAILSFIKYLLKIRIGDCLSYAMLIATAVSTAASAPSMAQKYGADSKQAANITLANTLLCIVTLPALYMLFTFVF